MRRRVPVIVTPEVGAVDIVRESGGGIVVAGDPELLGAAVCRLTTDLGLARSMGESGRRHATAYYRWHHIAAQMEALYENLSSTAQMNSRV